MSNKQKIAITGMGLEIPGWGERAALDILDGPITYGEFDPKSTLGKKGLRYKDRATLLALCAAKKALEDRCLLDVDASERETVGVLVSSNLGNMDTVCTESCTIRSEHVDKTSPMSLPVASSNIIPSTIAIRFGLKGINLMLCNGATSGIDALYIATKMLNAGRASKMLVVGVEPANDVSGRLMSECDPEPRNGPGSEAGELAACLILEPITESLDGDILGVFGEYEYSAPIGSAKMHQTPPDVWFIPPQTTDRSREMVSNALSNGYAGVPVVDTTSKTGEIYGALGVFQAFMAQRHLAQHGGKDALLSNGLTFGDGFSSIRLYS